MPASSSISTGTPEEMVALIEAARAEGCHSHSAKIGGSDPPADIARIEAIEAERLPDEQVTYDVNRAWTPDAPGLGVAPDEEWLADSRRIERAASEGWLNEPEDPIVLMGTDTNDGQLQKARSSASVSKTGTGLRFSAMEAGLSHAVADLSGG